METLYSIMCLWLLSYLVEGNDETELHQHLFANRHGFTELRPVRNKSKTIDVKFGISYLQLSNLNITEQILTSHLLVRQNWKDEMLVWDPKLFGNITEVNIDPRLVWVPDMTLYNNAVPGHSSGSLYNFKLRVKLRYNGDITWTAPVYLKSSCFVDVTWFPFDLQYCPLKFGSWSFHGYDVDIHTEKEHADLHLYVENNQYRVIKAPVTKRYELYPCCPEPFPVITYTIIFERIPGYFFYNIILTLIFMMSLSPMAFSTPNMSGNRVFLAIECFLTVVFISVLLFHKLPKNSDTTPILTKLILVSLILEGVILTCNIFVLDLSRRYWVPYMLRIILFKFVAPCIGLPYLQKYANASSWQNCRKLSETERRCRREKRDTEKLIGYLIWATSQGNERKCRNIWHVIAQTFDRCSFILFNVFYISYLLWLFLNALHVHSIHNIS